MKRKEISVENIVTIVLETIKETPDYLLQSKNVVDILTAGVINTLENGSADTDTVQTEDVQDDKSKDIADTAQSNAEYTKISKDIEKANPEFDAKLNSIFEFADKTIGLPEDDRAIIISVTKKEANGTGTAGSIMSGAISPLCETVIHILKQPHIRKHIIDNA